MPLPRRTQLNTVGHVHKSDNMKGIKTLLEKAKQDLIAAQKAKDAARIKQLEQNIANLTSTIERNS